MSWQSLISIIIFCPKKWIIVKRNIIEHYYKEHWPIDMDLFVIVQHLLQISYLISIYMRYLFLFIWAFCVTNIIQLRAIYLAFEEANYLLIAYLLVIILVYLDDEQNCFAVLPISVAITTRIAISQLISNLIKTK